MTRIQDKPAAIRKAAHGWIRPMGGQAGERPKLDTASISGFWEKCKYEIF